MLSAKAPWYTWLTYVGLLKAPGLGTTRTFFIFFLRLCWVYYLYTALHTDCPVCETKCAVCRALGGKQLALASVMVVDTPGLRNPRHSAAEQAAGWSEFCHNYLQERLLEHHHTHTFTHTLERYAKVMCSANSPQATIISRWRRTRRLAGDFVSVQHPGHFLSSPQGCAV